MTPKSQESPAAAVRGFPCGGCGATLTYAAGTTELRCERCGYRNAIAATPSAPLERDLAELDFGPASENRGFGVETRAFGCRGCGATTSFPAGTVATRCGFCGSAVVVETPSNGNLVRPETLIPFQLDREQAVARFRAWLGRLWFRPGDLGRLASLAGIQGIYTPFFTFDADALSHWSGEAGFHYYETEAYRDEKGQVQTRQVQKTRWEPRSGQHQALYDDELVCASRGLDSDRVGQVAQFDLARLVPYREEFLAGWSAEEYSIEPKELWARARAALGARERQACSALLGGDTQRNLAVDTAFRSVRWKHLLLPVYVAGYRYREKAYQFLVNGQTGEVAGNAPWSVWKIITLVLAVLAAIAAILTLVALRGS